MHIIFTRLADRSPQHRGQVVDAECSLIRDGPARTRLRLVNGATGRAWHCTFPHCLNFGVGFLPRCCQASVLLQ